MRSGTTLVGALLGVATLLGPGACDTTTGPSPRRDRAVATPRLERPRATSTTTASAPAAPAPPPCVADPTLAQPAVPAPADLVASIGGFVGDGRVASGSTSVSVWIDGYGEVLAHEPDLPLAPASNQKLFTGMSALAALGPDARLTTRILVGPGGELVVVGGGDPTLTADGPHSLAALAQQVRASGVTSAVSLLVDEAHHDGARRASGWQDWQIPTYTGPLSALMVDRNRWRADPAYLADPALGNAERLRDALAAQGITVVGPTAYATGPATGGTVATLESRPVVELVTEMLLRSDNQIADLLLEEVGTTGGAVGSMAAGASVGTASLAPLCVPLTGRVDDGSGLSRGNSRSAREWRMLLQAARSAPWWPQLVGGLPVAARSGTLASRFGGTAAAGNVRAKTGTIIGGSALSGYGTTASGRAFVFSVVVNGPSGQTASGAIDELIAGVAAHAG